MIMMQIQPMPDAISKMTNDLKRTEDVKGNVKTSNNIHNKDKVNAYTLFSYEYKA